MNHLEPTIVIGILLVSLAIFFCMLLYHQQVGEPRPTVIDDTKWATEKIDRILNYRYGTYYGVHMKDLQDYHNFIRHLVGEFEFLDTLEANELDGPNARYVLNEDYEASSFLNPKLLICPCCDCKTFVYDESIGIHGNEINDYACLNPICSCDELLLSDLESANPGM